MALQGFLSLVKAQSTPISFIDEATTTSDDKVYQISNTSKRTWSYADDVEVKDDGSIASETYIVDKLNGIITFNSVDNTRNITVSGKYVALTIVAEAKAWTFDGTTDLVDSTVFDKTAKEFTPTLNSATITINKFYDIDNYFIDVLQNKEVIVVELYADKNDDPIKLFAMVSSNSISTSIESLIEEGISLQATDKMIIGG